MRESYGAGPAVREECVGGVDGFALGFVVCVVVFIVLFFVVVFGRGIFRVQRYRGIGEEGDERYEACG